MNLTRRSEPPASPRLAGDGGVAPRREARPFEGLTIVVPAFNEEESLAKSVAEMIDAASTLRVTLEILVVDDGSTDRTAWVASEMAAADPRVSVMRHEQNRRLGAALRTGIAGARHPRIILDPVDCPLRPEEFRALYEGCGRADIAVGFRDGRPGYPDWLRFASSIYHSLLRVALGVRLRDYNWCCGYRREIFESLPFHFDGIIALPEILARAHRAGLKLVEVPVGMRPRTVGKGTVRRIRVWTKLAIDLVRLAIDLRVRPTPRVPALAVAGAEGESP
ncbi:MAG: glycosyltransferase family 2 protein [Planctomycetes bacterium]|nr:glycosyltransferase family 2 protein [Planctomycetota bacterium]MBI3845852.1 glycosyltransferase family 2 protein [Planctomycetota bacterium]